MGKFYDHIPSDHIEWAMNQPMFFTATAPLIGKHVNVSPKGMVGATFTITSPNSAMYIDGTGSGSETISHLYENGRITIMLMSFDKAPGILRFFGRGTVVERDAPEFEGLMKKLGHKSKDDMPGARAVIKVDIFKVGTSCGFGVPMLTAEKAAAAVAEHNRSKDVEAGNEGRKVRAADYFEERNILLPMNKKWHAAGKLVPYQQQNNTWSLDRCTGLRSARKANGQWLWVYDGASTAKRIVVGEWEAVLVGMLFGILLMFAARNLGLLMV